MKEVISKITCNSEVDMLLSNEYDGEKKKKEMLTSIFVTSLQFKSLAK